MGVMKVLLVVTLALLVCIHGKHENEFTDRVDANSFLTLPESFIRVNRAARGWFSSSSNKVDKIKKKWSTTCKFNSVEKWDEFKDEVEETSLPEAEVDKLESCTSTCYWKDQAKDIGGRGYEEKRETQEENNDPFEPACPKCFNKVPS